MASALVPLANLTLSAAQATVTFSSISGAYRDLRLVISHIDSGGVARAFGNTRFNGDAGSNYDTVRAEGSGSATSSSTVNNTVFQISSFIYQTGANPNAAIIDIMDYSATDKQKTVLFRSNNADYGTIMAAGKWASTAAVNSITLYAPSSYGIGSSFMLYGVSA